MKKLIIIQNFIILLVIIPFIFNAQDSLKLKTISKNVGEIIDAEERKEYKLFDEYADDIFNEAQFFENPDKSKLLVIYFKDGTKKEKVLTQTEYFEYQTQINKRFINYDGIDSALFCIIKLYDESSISGKIIEVLEKEIKVRTKYMGLITIPKNRIFELVVLKSNGKQFNKFWMPNPHDSRHYFAPTARNMPKGVGYFQDIYLLIMSANYAITDYLTIGGGLSIVPGISADRQGYFIYPKAGFDLTEKISVGGGLLYANIPDREEIKTLEEITIPIYFGPVEKDTTVIDTAYNYINHRINVGILFGVGTYGNQENNVTLGMGYAYFKDDILKVPVFMFGGMCRLSRRTALVTENWIYTVPYKYLWEGREKRNHTSVIISYGIRFFGERMSVDLAFFQITGEMGIGEFIFPGIPYLDFVVKF
ncbi:MAG: hypothetical protein KAT68_02770 [Bacteroidales bacterium]|nr:hypothetical protein [Bacteroidales bacterium]